MTGKSNAPPPPFRQTLTTMLTATKDAVVAEIDKSANLGEFATLKASLTTSSEALIKLQIPSTEFEKKSSRKPIKN